MTTTTVTPTATAWDIHTQSILNKGGTFDRLGHPASTGVAVTIAVKETVPYLSAEAIEKHRSSIRPGNYLGTWYDPENRRWEISETAVFDSSPAALRLARTLGERFVYDIDTDECVPVS